MKTFWTLFVLIIPATLLYSPFLGNPLVFDDGPFFYGNTSGEDYTKYLNTRFSLLRWLPYATFIWTKELIGEAVTWLHLGNLIIHLLTVITMFLFLRRLFEQIINTDNDTDNNSLSAHWLAFFAALIFSLHPVCVYAVAYLSQRSILMATLFALLTWRFFLEGLIRLDRRWLWASTLSYFLAALSKEHAIMIPAVAVALLFLLDKQPWQRIKFVWETFVIYGLIAVFVIIQIKSRNYIGAAYEPVATEYLSRLGSQFDARLVYPLSILTQSFLFFKYLWVWIVPSPAWMSVDLCQSFPLNLWSFPELIGLIGFIIYPVVAIRLLLQQGIKGLFGFALLCPWLLFATEISTVRIQEMFVLYRSYLWMILAFAVIPFLCQYVDKTRAIIILTVISLLMMPLTWDRLSTFTSPFLLWNDAAIVLGNNDDLIGADRIFINRGVEFYAQGRYDEAIADYNRAINAVEKSYHGNDKENPQDSSNQSSINTPKDRLSHTYYVRGKAYLMKKDYIQAIKDFDRAIELVPARTEKTYLYKAEALEGSKQFTEALQIYEMLCSRGSKNACKKQKDLESRLLENKSQKTENKKISDTLTPKPAH